MSAGKAPCEARRSNRQIVSTRASLAKPPGGMGHRLIAQFDDAQDTRDTGVFFGFVFCHAEANEHSAKSISPNR